MREQRIMNRFKSIIMVAFAVFVGVGLFAPTYTAAAQESSASLSIVPKKNYIIEPGKSVEDTLVIRNLDNVQPLRISLRVIDFTFTDNGGTPKLFLDADTPQTTWSLKPFMTVPESLEIAPGESKSVDMKVSIPEGHGAGSYYSAIIYGTGASSGGNVGLSASGVTLVFTTIPGQVTEDLTLKKFGAYTPATPDKKAGYSYMNEKEPKTIAYTLENKGNVTEAPVGSITLRDMFGHERKITDVNPSGSLALIGQTRTYTACIKLTSADVNFNGSKTEANTCASPGLWPGYYRASLDLYYGQNGNVTQEITGNTSFWYLPWWFVIAVLVILAALALTIWRIVVKIRNVLYGPRFKKSSLRRRR